MQAALEFSKDQEQWQHREMRDESKEPMTVHVSKGAANGSFDNKPSFGTIVAFWAYAKNELQRYFRILPL